MAYDISGVNNVINQLYTADREKMREKHAKEQLTQKQKQEKEMFNANLEQQNKNRELQRFIGEQRIATTREATAQRNRKYQQEALLQYNETVSSGLQEEAQKLLLEGMRLEVIDEDFANQVKDMKSSVVLQDMLSNPDIDDFPTYRDKLRKFMIKTEDALKGAKIRAELSGQNKNWTTWESFMEQEGDEQLAKTAGEAMEGDIEKVSVPLEGVATEYMKMSGERDKGGFWEKAWNLQKQMLKGPIGTAQWAGKQLEKTPEQRIMSSKEYQAFIEARGKKPVKWADIKPYLRDESSETQAAAKLRYGQKVPVADLPAWASIEAMTNVLSMTPNAAKIQENLKKTIRKLYTQDELKNKYNPKILQELYKTQ